jgi:hypothetical protein
LRRVTRNFNAPKSVGSKEKLNCVFLKLRYNGLEKETEPFGCSHPHLMTLDDTQRKKVAEWIAAGMKLSEIQNHLASELGVRMTYMDVRLLVDDLKLTPKDIEPPKPAAPILPAASPTPSVPETSLKIEKEPVPEASLGGVSVSVDHLARPGAVVSGKVTFTDGQKADWYIDQTGRLGLAPTQAGYRPAPGDVQQFQAALETELSRMGL